LMCWVCACVCSVSAAEALAGAGTSGNTVDDKKGSAAAKPLPSVPLKKPASAATSPAASAVPTAAPSPLRTRVTESIDLSASASASAAAAAALRHSSIAPPPPSEAPPAVPDSDDDEPVTVRQPPSAAASAAAALQDIKPATAQSVLLAAADEDGDAPPQPAPPLTATSFQLPTEDEIKAQVAADVQKQREEDAREDARRAKELADAKRQRAAVASATASSAAPPQPQLTVVTTTDNKPPTSLPIVDDGADSDPDYDPPAPPLLPNSDEDNDVPPQFGPISLTSAGAGAGAAHTFAPTSNPGVSPASPMGAAAAALSAKEKWDKEREGFELGQAKKLLRSDEVDHEKKLRINAFKHEKLDTESILNDWKTFFRLEQGMCVWVWVCARFVLRCFVTSLSSPSSTLFDQLCVWLVMCGAAQLDYLRKEVEDIFELSAGDMTRVRQEIELMDRDLNNTEYFLLKKIGGGGFGAVYKGLKRDTNSTVAIKIIDLEEAADDIQTITREIATLAQGMHCVPCSAAKFGAAASLTVVFVMRVCGTGKHCPQLVNYYGSTVKGTKLWIAMEYVDGGAVLDAMKERKMLEEKYIAIVGREVLLGLAYLATNGKIHRDIKAANILLSKSGAVKLADFGASRQLTDTVQKCNTFVGSPYWMAPEGTLCCSLHYVLHQSLTSLMLILMRAVMMQANYDGKVCQFCADCFCLAVLGS
jgi:hypothetical protein